MKISIIIANYNYDQFLSSAIDSALKQTYNNTEIIIVDDGSTDNSRKIITQIQKQNPNKVKIKFQENQGHGVAIESGFQISTGEIIAFLDSDDLWIPQKVEKIAEAFQDSEVIGAMHHLKTIDSEGKVLQKKIKKRKLPHTNLAKLIIDTGSTWHFPPTSGLAFRQSALKQVLPMSPREWVFWPDGCLLYCTAFLGKVILTNEYLGYYRIHGANTFASTAKPTKKKQTQSLEGIKITNQWLNNFLGRINYPERVSLYQNLDYRRSQYYLQGTWDFEEMEAISGLILKWPFYTPTERLNYLIKFWLKAIFVSTRKQIKVKFYGIFNGTRRKKIE